MLGKRNKVSNGNLHVSLASISKNITYLFECKLDKFGEIKYWCNYKLGKLSKFGKVVKGKLEHLIQVYKICIFVEHKT